jgi:type II secretory pathway pseudopilin PulG
MVLVTITYEEISIGYTVGMNQKGITVLELLVVFLLIAAAVALAVFGVTAAHEKSRITKAVDQLAQLNTATQIYLTDTLQFPPDCGYECTESTDPYLVNVGSVAKWGGPYLLKGVWDMQNPWGGRYMVGTGDVAGTGENLQYFFMTSPEAELIPEASLQKIDATIDDGDLSTGRVRGNGLGFGTGIGELTVLFER